MNRSSLFWRSIFACLLGFFWGSASAQVVIEYVHTDALGSPIAISDGVGNVIEREIYEPYGGPIKSGTIGSAGFRRTCCGFVNKYDLHTAALLRSADRKVLIGRSGDGL